MKMPSLHRRSKNVGGRKKRERSPSEKRSGASPSPVAFLDSCFMCGTRKQETVIRGSGRPFRDIIGYRRKRKTASAAQKNIVFCQYLFSFRKQLWY